MTNVNRLLRGGTLRARSSIAVASTLAAVALLGGCGGDDGASPSGEDAVAVPVYFVDDQGTLVPVNQEVDGVDQMSSQGRALAAVNDLIRDVPDKDSGLTSHWGGSCGVGAGVDSLRKQSGLITIKLSGPTGVACSRKGDKETQQSQQLAWTVVQNLGGDPSTPIQVFSPNGALLYKDLVADETILAG